MIGTMFMLCFFSSRRRHTRLQGDWSSDVCSSDLVAPWPFLKAGQFVYINHGPLAGVEGIVIASKNRSRLVVSVEMLRRSVTVEIQYDWAEPSKPAYSTSRERTAA